MIIAYNMSTLAITLKSDPSFEREPKVKYLTNIDKILWKSDCKYAVIHIEIIKSE